MFFDGIPQIDKVSREIPLPGTAHFGLMSPKMGEGFL
jgi:hypothetical protein